MKGQYPPLHRLTTENQPHYTAKLTHSNRILGVPHKSSKHHCMIVTVNILQNFSMSTTDGQKSDLSTSGVRHQKRKTPERRMTNAKKDANVVSERDVSYYESRRPKNDDLLR